MPQEPPPQLLIEYKPLVPEEAEEPEPEPEPVETPKPKKRKKRKKKPAGATPEAATEQLKPVATPPPRPAAQPQPKTASTPLWALSPEEAEAAITGSSPSKKKGAATQAGKSEGQKRHEKEHAARAKKREEEEDARLAAADKGRKLGEQLEETKARAGLIAMLGGLRTNLTAARDALPDDDDHDAIYDEADEGVTALSAFLDGPGKTASSVTLNGKVEAIKSLISKVRGFRPPETPEQRRARRFEEVKTNVGLAFGRADWRGRYGGEADFTVDKTDIVMRDMIVAHYGRDTNEIPGHAAKDYPDRTPTSKVYYYVTGSSHTLGIAYDISLHAYDGDTQLGTVHVLHIRHRDE